MQYKHHPVFVRWYFVYIPAAFSLIVFLVSYFILNLWILEFLSFFMPVILVSNFLCLLVVRLFRMEKRYWILPLLAVLISLKPLNETFALNLTNSTDEAHFTVMSFNAAFFNPYRFKTLESDVMKYAEFNKYLREKLSPDILCIQEFFYSSKTDYDNTLDSIAANGGYDFYYTNPNYNSQLDGLYGVITFSRFPVVKSGAIRFKTSDYVNGHWNDFVIKNDTVRVVNFQLESMSIRWRKFEYYSLFSNILFNIHDIYMRLSRGYQFRKEQMKIISEFLRESPHKVIICADINALPYSDTYQLLKRTYHNSFEKAGFGFGFTYHHFPWFIRIDNQFFDSAFHINYHCTLKEIEISDHYPIMTGYSFH